MLLKKKTPRETDGSASGSGQPRVSLLSRFAAIFRRRKNQSEQQPQEPVAPRAKKPPHKRLFHKPVTAVKIIQYALLAIAAAALVLTARFVYVTVINPRAAFGDPQPTAVTASTATPYATPSPTDEDTPTATPTLSPGRTARNAGRQRLHERPRQRAADRYRLCGGAGRPDGFSYRHDSACIYQFCDGRSGYAFTAQRQLCRYCLHNAQMEDQRRLYVGRRCRRRRV